MLATYDILLERLTEAFGRVVPGADPVLRPSERCDYQANGALALAKQRGTTPREVAQLVLDQLTIDDLGVVEITGPGFLSITLRTSFLSNQLEQLSRDDRLGIAVAASPRTIVIDYSAPNVAKEMHVGHLRGTIIGDALRRVKQFEGNTVIARNHVGDWGTPFGMLIEHLIDIGETNAAATLSIGDLDDFYRAARRTFDEDDEFRERSRARVVLLQAGDVETRRLWRLLVDQSMTYFSEVYDLLDVLLVPSEVVGESSYNDALKSVVADLDAAGLLVESGGAQCVFPEGFVNREGEPLPLIIQKSDEGFGYAATDLAALRDRIDNLHADDIYYVVGAPQSQHLEMVFAVARSAGWLPESVHCEHVAFGNVLGPDHKILRTRAGQSIKLASLLHDASDRAYEALAQRGDELGDDERRATALAIARAAIKYADLSTERQRDYVFDLERMVTFEGDTGPYLAYAHTRVRSLFRRLNRPWEPGAVKDFSLGEPAERSLALGLLGFPETLDATSRLLAPNKLCSYLFDLAQRFTTFYETCPVLSAPPALREERLALCDLVARTLSLGLGLLGIEAPERM